MKNIQVIDEGINTRYAIYAVTDQEFALLFPDDRQDVEFIEDVVLRLGENGTDVLMTPIWERLVLKPQAQGIHGTLFYGLPEKKRFYEDKREPPIDSRLVE